MLRAMKVLGIGLINAFALPTVIGKRAPFPTRGKTGGLHRAQPRPAPKRKGQEDQARRRQKGPRSDLRHLLIQGAQAVLRMGRATALGQWGPKRQPPCRRRRRRPQAVGPTLAHVLGQPGLMTSCPLASAHFKGGPADCQYHPMTNEPKTNRLDGGSAPPKPTPLAAAGVRGNLHYGLPAASLEKIKTNELFLA